MAIKNIIAKGIGFSPGSVKYIPTHGFSIGEAPSPPVWPTVMRVGFKSRLAKKNSRPILGK